MGKKSVQSFLCSMIIWTTFIAINAALPIYLQLKGESIYFAMNPLSFFGFMVADKKAKGEGLWLSMLVNAVIYSVISALVCIGSLVLCFTYLPDVPRLLSLILAGVCTWVGIVLCREYYCELIRK